MTTMNTFGLFTGVGILVFLSCAGYAVVRWAG